MASSFQGHPAIMEEDGIQLHRMDNVAIIVMNRGENRFNIPFVTAMNKVLDAVERDETYKGLVTTGSGKFYSNGLDLEWLLQAGQDQGMEFMNLVNKMFMRILTFPLPTVAAMNGHAFAGGAVLAMTHDLRAMREDRGWFCFNEVFIGRVFPTYMLSFMRVKMGQGAAFTDAVVLGKRFTGPEAFSKGFAHAICKEALLLREAARLVKSYAGKDGFPRKSLTAMKEEVYRDAFERSKNLSWDDSTPVMKSHL